MSDSLLAAIAQTPSLYRLRSYVARGRLSHAQAQAYLQWQPLYGLKVGQGWIDYQQLFGRKAKRYLEIGFGMGQSLLFLANANRDIDYIGVEAHRPGIGALCQGIALQGLSNLRFYHHDVMDVLENCIPDQSLDGLQIFFPDPWPKRRHHQRRLIQPEFIALVSNKLNNAGELHLATDWEDYAKQMMQVLSAQMRLVNLAGERQFALQRSRLRPVVTRFESKALREGRRIWELQFRIDC